MNEEVAGTSRAPKQRAAPSRFVPSIPDWVSAILGLVICAGFYWALFSYFPGLFRPLLLYYPNILYAFFMISIIAGLRTSRGEEVYIIFYTFFLFASIAFAITLYLHSSINFDVRTFKLSDLSGLDNRTTYLSALRRIIEMLTDADGEFKLLGLILGLILAPQLLSFIVAGIFGCGCPPRFVGAATGTALVFLMKFFCTLSAINVGVASCLLFIGFETSGIFRLVLGQMSDSIEPLFFAFLIAALHRTLDFIGLLLTAPLLNRWVALIYYYMVRFTKIDLPLQPYETIVAGTSDFIDLRHIERYPALVTPRVVRSPAEDSATIVIARFAAERLRERPSDYVDRDSRRISWLVEYALRELAHTTHAEPSVLFRDGRDGRLWVWSMFASHAREGHARARLSVITSEEARNKYAWEEHQVDRVPDLKLTPPS